MKIFKNYLIKKIFFVAAFFFVIPNPAYAFSIKTISYDEIAPLGEGVEDGLGYIWRLQWDGKDGNLRVGPTDSEPDEQKFWKSSVLFSVPDSGDEPIVTFFSLFHARPNAIGHLGDHDRNQELKFGVFETGYFTDFLGVGTHRIEKRQIEHPSDSTGKHMDLLFVDFIKEDDGDLFFEMRGEHTLVTEPGSLLLVALSLLGLVSRRYRDLLS